MPNTLNQIWEGDKLDRRREAAMLEKFLTSETLALHNLGREQSFVLALDAQYGEGKTWFLSRFRHQIEFNHPVAFVDAWVDDGNNEPLVSIMAAIEDAIQPFLRKKKVSDNFKALTRAALPIIGKAVIGAGGKLVSKYLGDEFSDVAKAAVKAASEESGDKEALAAGVGAAVDGLSGIVDNIGAAMLAQYRARQTSRDAFKASLRALALSIDILDDPRQAPIYVIVDELDRCRPSYAIALLEEIKHLFDVPGVVFVIALHGLQLTHSINAVYGEKFESKAYLRRFFTRTYELRRLSIRELVISHFSAIAMGEVTFGAPEVWDRGSFGRVKSEELAGNLLTDWAATPREAQSVIDALRLFVTNWDSKLPIELPLVLALILNMVRGDPVVPTMSKWSRRPQLQYAVWPSSDAFGSPEPINESALLDAYPSAIGKNLRDHATGTGEMGIYAYIQNVMNAEFASISGSRVSGTHPMPSWAEYAERVMLLGGFVEREPSESEPSA